MAVRMASLPWITLAKIPSGLGRSDQFVERGTRTIEKALAGLGQSDASRGAEK
jgi:hypothetical protein